MYCPKCGRPVPDEASYCGSCGTRLVDFRRQGVLGLDVARLQREGPVCGETGDAYSTTIGDEPYGVPTGAATVLDAQRDTRNIPTGQAALPRSEYLGLTGLLLSLIFAIMGFETLIVRALDISVVNWPVLIGMVAILIIGYLLLKAAGQQGGQLGWAVGGYLLITLDFGYFISQCTTDYTVGTFVFALLAICGICVAVTAVGYSRPSAFDSLSGIFLTIFGACLVTCLVSLLGGRGWIGYDWLVLGFCSCMLAYDIREAANDTPTAYNALRHSINIYVDIFFFIALVLVILSGGSHKRRR